MIPTTIPHGHTARRLDWAHLPPHIRATVEARCGSPVVEADSRTSGFTPGFASVLVCADGSRHFVKAASTVAQRMFADAYREEARKLRLLPADVPAPGLLWVHDADDWLVLGFEYVDGRPPQRPWLPEDLANVSATVAAMAKILTPAPAGIETAAEAFGDWPALWDRLDDPHAADCRALAARFEPVVTGDTLVHCDIRDDNLLLGSDGSVHLCDWNWPVVGAAWLDSLFLLIGPRGDGLDVEAHIAEHPLLSAVDPESVDIVLVLLLGYFATAADLPVPPTSPYVRRVQAWQRDVVRDWLAERRGWA